MNYPYFLDIVKEPVNCTLRRPPYSEHAKNWHKIVSVDNALVLAKELFLPDRVLKGGGKHLLLVFQNEGFINIIIFWGAVGVAPFASNLKKYKSESNPKCPSSFRGGIRGCSRNAQMPKIRGLFSGVFTPHRPPRQHLKKSVIFFKQISIRSSQ